MHTIMMAFFTTKENLRSKLMKIVSFFQGKVLPTWNELKSLQYIPNCKDGIEISNKILGYDISDYVFF